MLKSFIRIGIILVFVFGAIGIGALVIFPTTWDNRKNRTEQHARVIIPRNISSDYTDMDYSAENLAREDSMFSKVSLEDGEVIVSVLTEYIDEGPVEKQFVAYRNLLEIESPIYLTYIDYDEATQNYTRIWSAKTAASRPGTVSLYTLDILGDRSLCVLLTGMNGLGQHTLTIFRKNPLPAQDPEDLFVKIAELRIDGTITIRETARTAQYQSGQANGASFTISAFGRDMESSNFLDQVEISYAFNEDSGVFEEKSMTRIPGIQVEQRRVRELLGNPKVFEEFVTGLWYHITPQGDVDMDQYIYFDPPNREIIFYGDETQQVFNWDNSAATRYGLYVSSQNISVTTLRRSIDIELETLESIRVRVIEDVRLKFGVNTSWDGSYRKAAQPENRTQTTSSINAHINAWYEGSMGKIHFSPNGSFELNTGNTLREGKYAFFSFNDQELLELRSTEPVYTEYRSDDALNREIYLVEGEKTEDPLMENISLIRVRIGSRGIQRLHERVISLTLAEE